MIKALEAAEWEESMIEERVSDFWYRPSYWESPGIWSGKPAMSEVGN